MSPLIFRPLKLTYLSIFCPLKQHAGIYIYIYNKLIILKLLAPYVLQSLQEQPSGTHFFNFTFKNCKVACFFDFVRYFILHFSSIIGNGLNPRMCRMDVWSRQAITTPQFITLVLWKIQNFVHDLRRNIHFTLKFSIANNGWILMDGKAIILDKQS